MCVLTCVKVSQSESEREREGRKAYSREKGRENESKKKVGDAVKVFSSACKCMEEERGVCACECV